MFRYILSQRLERLKMFNNLIPHSCHRTGNGQGVSIWVGKIGIVTSTVLILLKARRIISGHCPAAYNDAIRRWGHSENWHLRQPPWSSWYYRDEKTEILNAFWLVLPLFGGLINVGCWKNTRKVFDSGFLMNFSWESANLWWTAHHTAINHFKGVWLVLLGYSQRSQ